MHAILHTVIQLLRCMNNSWSDLSTWLGGYVRYINIHYYYYYLSREYKEIYLKTLRK